MLVSIRIHGTIIPRGNFWKANLPSCCTEVIRWHQFSSIPSPLRITHQNKAVVSSDSSPVAPCISVLVVRVGWSGRGGGGWTFTPLLGTRKPVSRSQCKCHGLMDFQLLSDATLETRLGPERDVSRLLGKVTVPNFSDSSKAPGDLQPQSWPAHPPHCLPETRQRLSKESDKVSRRDKSTKDTELSS